MSKTYSREEFYELVWSKPITHLAKEFALSDVAIHKICRKHDIPTPPPGWWAKKTAGKKVKQTSLPRLDDGSAGRIVITSGELRREAEFLLAVREQARIQASSLTAKQQPPAHPIVECTIAKLRKAKASSDGLVSVDGKGVINCTAAAQSIDRLELILNRLAEAVALVGFRLEAGDGYAQFMSANESISFSITEQTKRVKHELTAEELRQEEQWRQKQERQRARGRWDWSFSRPTFPEWDYHCTGRLSLEFEAVYIPYGGVAPRRSFSDGKVQRLENMANDIAVGLAVLAAAKVEQRLRREEDQRRHEEERRRRELVLRAKHINERRTKGLEGIISELEEVDRLRRLLDSLRPEVGSTATDRVAEFIRWSERYLAEREATLSHDGMQKRFEEQRLFGDDDDHDFRKPYWH